ncbi:MAG: DUF4292 domain-containing protein [Schleiferiaceae bacterium]|nr:DUF4292 domain-containing protein [Schleiferiaceae bacterium]
MYNSLKISFLLVAITVLAGCKSKKPLAERMEKLEDLQTTELVGLMANTKISAKSIQMKGNGEVDFGGRNQSFKLEVRMVPDSIIWLDLSEPTFGLKVARVQMTRDTVAYYSRLLRRGDVGSFEKFSNLLGAPIDFGMFQSALIGSPAVMPTKDLTSGLFDQSTYFLKGKPEHENIALFVTLLLNPVNQRLSRQTILTEKEQLEATYGDYQTVAGFVLPHTISLSFISKALRNTLQVEVKEYQINTPLKFPFNMPANYEPL